MPITPPNPKELGYYVALAQVCLEMVAPLGLGIVLDHYLDWTPWGTVGGAIFGFIGGMIHLIVMVAQHDAAKRSRPPGDEQ